METVSPKIFILVTTQRPAGRRQVKCLLDSGALHCFLSLALLAQLPSSCRRQPPAGDPQAVLQADGSLRPTGGVVAALLVLGGLDEETSSVEFDRDVACNTDLILGYHWLQAHGPRLSSQWSPPRAARMQSHCSPLRPTPRGWTTRWLAWSTPAPPSLTASRSSSAASPSLRRDLP
jgi:hypothetical protein